MIDAGKFDLENVRGVSLVAVIGKLYDIERQAREAMRARECPALLVALKALIIQTAGGALLKKGLWAKACTYDLNHWERVERYAGPGNGMAEIDANRAE